MQRRPGRPFHRSRLRYDGAFRTELAYCFEKGLPHSHLLGGPLKWTPEDRAKLVAYSLEAAERCAMCGTASWEWEEDRFAYAAVRQTCMGCQQKDLLRDDDTPNPPGTSIVLIPKEQAERLLAALHRGDVVDERSLA